ncbi:YfhO family protein [Riemerella anatipestifer]|uniref:YfhO family protein n=1 Tax=Riemerella anatipestifer TaxID=34085 RepID=UPI00285AF5D4|nr:YfhO family protein [Riemerella anatipestifer]MDR7794607.1 YfhO family protein [Riemerella anatipestifer]
MNLKNKNLIFIIGSLVIFVLIAILYANPIISGKQLMQPDIVHYKGGAKELLDYRAKYGTETYWSDAMFGGMPTYQTGAQFRGDLIKQVDNLLNFLPKPANYLFLLFSGFFLLGMVAVRNWKYALLGASFFGLSTYFYIIIAAGHNGKVHTVAYFAPLLAGILLAYIRKKYILGFIVTALFMGLQIAANHIQMTYYLFIALGFLFISELVRAIKGNTTWKHFGISSGVLALAIALGVGMNAQKLMANAEYVKETVRGKQILNTEKGNTEKSGMDKESITMWSYGKLETFNLFIPRLMGGGSQEKDSERMMGRIQELVQENATSQEEVNNIIRGLSSPTYWGDQPMTSGPAYQGAVVCFLAVLGFVFARRKYKYWILGASALTIMLAWGHHFMPLTDFFIEYVPLYNKFRAPSSILVVVELLFPLIGILGLYQFFKNQNLSKELKQKYLIYTTASVLGFTVILLVGGKSLLDFYNDTEKTYLPLYLLNYLQDERWQFFRADAIKAILYVGITAIVLWLSLKEKLSQNIALVIIGLVSLFDLWTVNQRYLNSSNFVDKTFAENPFQTENNDYLIGKAGDNPYIQGLLSQVNINKTLETLAEKDKSHYRIFNNTLGTFGETNTSYFKASIGGYSAAKLRRYDDLINEYFSKQDTVALPKVLNMLNAKYFVVGSADNPQAYPNPDANGNAWFVSDILWANTPNEEIKAIGTIDNKRTAVVSTEDKSYFNGKNIQPDSTAYIQLTQYQPNEIQLKSQSKTPQLAVISEIYYPKGWKMFVDNQEVPYIKANYLLRAVYVPAGNHTIKMVFDPEVLHKGKLWSYGAFGVFILLSILGILKLYKEQNATA